MTVEQKVYSILSTNASLTAVVPSARIKPPGDWQRMAKPYLVHFPVSVRPIETHQGRVGLKHWSSYQVSVVSSSTSNARTVADLVVSALEGLHDGVQVFWTNLIHLGYDKETNTSEYAIEFDVWEAL